MITPSLTAALAHKAAAPFPASIRISGGQWQVVNKLQTMTTQQHDGFEIAHEWHQVFGANSCFHPMQFEINEIKPKGQGAALANELRQLGLLQCINGLYRLTAAGLSLATILNTRNQEC